MSKVILPFSIYSKSKIIITKNLIYYELIFIKRKPTPATAGSARNNAKKGKNKGGKRKNGSIHRGENPAPQSWQLMGS